MTARLMGLLGPSLSGLVSRPRCSTSTLVRGEYFAVRLELLKQNLFSLPNESVQCNSIESSFSTQ